MSSRVSYLRISLTDKCDLKCFYCSTGQPRKYYNHEELLSYEEILLIQDAAAEIGIKKIRLTGGEPLLRRNVTYLIQEMRRRRPEIELAITTNAQMLPELGDGILSANLGGINISLDSMDSEKYRQMTRGGDLKKTLKGIQMAIDAKIPKVKINAVLIKGFNDDEVIKFATLAKNFPVVVRFIEYMPIGKNGWDRKRVVPGYIAREIISKEMDIFPVFENDEEIKGPEREFFIKGGLGRIGFINPISHRFCSQCNRLRITCSGKVKPCLFSKEETDIKSIMRSENFSAEKLKNVMKRCIKEKKFSYDSEDNDREMWAIGG